ncbi:MAG: tetratricopeptide repeat protein [Bacteroidota bacterium]|nr:tetratricopeptide repeat protein [Bacteroidota bacterium]
MKLFIPLVLFFLYSCDSFTDEELWIKIEQAKANKNWDSTLQVSQRIIRDFPQGRYAGWARFALAESYRFKNRPREALDNYKLFHEQYPEMQPAALSMFLTGYMYNNNLQMYDSAKIYYEEFLQKFPNHDLAPTVKFELESMGKSPQEALNERQQRKSEMAKK